MKGNNETPPKSGKRYRESRFEGDTQRNRSSCIWSSSAAPLHRNLDEIGETEFEKNTSVRSDLIELFD